MYKKIYKKEVIEGIEISGQKINLLNYNNRTMDNNDHVIVQHKTKCVAW